jgi:hypothetical protein
MTDWYERTIKALQLNGKGERTQESYARAVRMLSEFYEKTPGSCHCSGHIGLLTQIMQLIKGRASHGPTFLSATYCF